MLSKKEKLMRWALTLVSAGFFIAGATASAIAQKPPNPSEKRSAAPSSATSPRGGEAPDPQIMIQMANDYFNASQFMTADFVQIGADGRRSEGKLYVYKPGRLRFEYAQPASMEIIADGLSVAIRDRKLRTQQLYFIDQTPLKFLLKTSVDLKRDMKIIDVSSDAKATSILVEDKATIGGTSKIKLMFDARTFSLKQWEVTDPQGYQTLVTLHNVDTKSRPDGALFKIPQEGIFPFQN
jgi:outer membrane lipoprotein-sorting protein